MSTMRDAKHGGPALCTSVSILIWMEDEGWFVRMRLNSDVQYAKLGPYQTEGEAMVAAADKMRTWR